MEQLGDKYEFTEETIKVLGKVLHRIKAVRDFEFIKAGELGGYIEKEENLSHEGNCWVSNDAAVYGNARVFDDAWVYGNARVFDDARVFGAAEIRDYAWVYGNAKIYGDAKIYGAAKVYGEAEICRNTEIKGKTDYIVFKNWWSSGRYFTWTRSNNMWKVGCFCGTGEQLIKKAYEDSEISGREYERVVRYVESILADNNNAVEVKSSKNPMKLLHIRFIGCLRKLKYQLGHKSFTGHQ